jgi:hypothetical protein
MITLPQARLRNGLIPAEDGRQLFRFIRHWRPIEITADDARGYRHPFSAVMNWDPGDKRWEVQFFRDSYVSGTHVREVEGPPLDWDYLPEATRNRFGDDDPGTDVVPWLSEEPWLPVNHWRSLGTDAALTFGDAETIPQPLLDLGAGTGDEVRINREELTFTISRGGTPAQRENRRLCRAADVVLNLSRERVRLDAGADGALTAELDPPSRQNPWITIERGRFEPAGEIGSVLEQFAASLDDTGVDRFLVARLYLLSPPGEPEGSEPSSTWSPYIDQAIFWNPQYRIDREINLVEPLRLTFPTGLAGGVGDGLISATLADINLRDALASALVSDVRVTGEIFT